MESRTPVVLAGVRVGAAREAVKLSASKTKRVSYMVIHFIPLG